MAIDTAEKRRSVAGIPFFPLGPGVTPNASPDQEWRQQVGWGYSGILAAEAVVAVIGSVVEIVDSAAFVVALTDSSAYSVELTEELI